MYLIEGHRIHPTDLYAIMRESNELARNYFNGELSDASVYCLADCIAIGYVLLEISNQSNCFADLPEDVGPAYMQSNLLTSPRLLCLAEKLYTDSHCLHIQHNNVYRAIYLVATELKAGEHIWTLLQMYPASEFQYAIVGVFLFSYISGLSLHPHAIS